MGKEIKRKLAKIKKGDNEEITNIVKEFELMIYSIINSYELEYGDYIISKDDLFQEGCLGLIEACKSYRINDSTKFSTYAFVVIERRIQRAFFHMIRPYRSEFSFDKFEFVDRIESLSAVSDNYSNYCANEEVEKLYKKGYMTELDRNIVKLRLANYSYKEIAKLLNITPKKVDNRISRIKKMYKVQKETEDTDK